LMHDRRRETAREVAGAARLAPHRLALLVARTGLALALKRAGGLADPALDFFDLVFAGTGRAFALQAAAARGDRHHSRGAHHVRRDRVGLALATVARRTDRQLALQCRAPSED